MSGPEGVHVVLRGGQLRHGARGAIFGLSFPVPVRGRDNRIAWYVELIEQEDDTCIAPRVEADTIAPPCHVQFTAIEVPTFAPCVPFAGDVAVRHKVLPADHKSTLAGLHVRLDYRPHPRRVILDAFR